MFPPELRTAAFVSRWNILWRSMPDNIAQHSFFVAWYAWMIADVIGWKGPTDYLLLKALEHDLDETISGDITGPVKKHILDDAKAEPYLERRMVERMGPMMSRFYAMENQLHDATYECVRAIVAAADALDAYLYLVVSEQMGNKAVVATMQANLASLEGVWRKLPATHDVLSRTWQTVVLPAIAAHRQTGGRGI